MLDITAIPQLARNLVRLREIVGTLAKYGLADWFARIDRRFVRKMAENTTIGKLSAVSHEARVRLALTELGTTFIKFGQVLSTRRDLIGSELADELAELQGNVPADPFDTVRATVEGELRRPLAEVFAEFAEAPIASASIGQAHRATLPDGRTVVVKVQHPDIARRVTTDLSIMAELARIAEEYLPELRAFRPVAVVEQFRRAILRELDFRRECRYLQLFRRAFADDSHVRFPEPFPDHSTGRVLTMEFLDGIPFTYPEKVRAAGGDLDALTRRGARVFLDMVFRDGVFHADPHPGNMLYLPGPDGGTIGLLDFGMVGRIDDALRGRIGRGLAAVMQNDAAELTELIAQVGEIPAKFDQEALQGEVAEQLAFYWGMPLEQFQLGTALNELTDAIRRYEVALPPPLAMLLRLLVILEGTGRLLSPGFNLTALLEPYKKVVAKRALSPRRVAARFLTAVQDWDDLVRHFPRQVAGLVRALQRQEITVQLSHRHLEPSVNRVVFGLVVSSLFLGSSMLWASKAPPLVFDLPVLGMSGCLVSGVLGFRLFRAIQHSGRLEERE